MNEKKSGFIGLTVGVLRNPLATFEQINERDLMRGFMLIIVLSIFTAISTAFYMSKIPIEILMPQIMQEGVDASIITESISTITVTIRVVGTVISYIFQVLVIHGITTLTGSIGALKRTFAINGFASLPLLLQQLLKVFDSFVSSPESLTSFLLTKNAITGKLMKIVASMNLFTIFGIATWILIGYGVSVNYGITKRKSLFVALVPYVLFFAFNFYLSS